MPEIKKNPTFQLARHFVKHWRNPKYITWIHEEFPDMEIHHLLGSMGPCKITDLLVVPIDRESHMEAQQSIDGTFNDYLPQSLNLLQKYITYLEGEIKCMKNELEILK